MDVLSKKSLNYRGFLLFESLLAMSLVCLMIMTYVSLNNFLFQNNQKIVNQQIMLRILYEEVSDYKFNEGNLEREIIEKDIVFKIRLIKKGTELIGAEISGNKDYFRLEKK